MTDETTRETIETTVDDATLDELIARIRRDTARGFPPRKLMVTAPAMARLEREAEQKWGLTADPRVRGASLHGVPIEIERRGEDRVRIIYREAQAR